MQCWPCVLFGGFLFAGLGSGSGADSGSGSGLAEALAQVVVNSEMGRLKTLYVYTHISGPSGFHLEELLTRLLVSLPATGQARRLFRQTPMEYKPYVHAVLVLVDDLESLAGIYGGIQATQDLSHTLVYVSRSTEAEGEEVQLALRLLWRLSVLNVGLVMRFPGQQELLMVSYFPFSVEHGCQVIRASVVNRFDLDSELWESSEYFPSKLGNFHGCRLTCATWQDMPYLVWRPGSGSFVGIEGALLQFLADNLNFSVGLYWMSKGEVLATFDESGSIFDEVSRASTELDSRPCPSSSHRSSASTRTSRWGDSTSSRVPAARSRTRSPRTTS